ncbi:MAG: hypothetical protein JWQ62_134, partial [Lacunisphaera sp.]|nr:hypothetical protein [Lacunisphaera sp.]
MNYFPHNSPKRRSASPAGVFAPVRQAILRDILWGQPLFKAPALPTPRISIDPL